MSKLEINNEVVKMRQSVRQARVHVVRKLVKEAKMLRSKRGKEKQQEKYKRKADRLTQEILAVKKIPDDDISKFAITNSTGLQEILGDVSSDAKTRVTAKLAHHKSLVDTVSKFKEKFPNYEDHLGPGRRKLIKLKRKAGKEAKKEAKKLEREQKLGSDGEQAANNDSENDTDNESLQNSSNENSDIEEKNLDGEKKNLETQGNELHVDAESDANDSNDDSMKGSECKGNSVTRESIQEGESLKAGILHTMEAPTKKPKTGKNKITNSTEPKLTKIQSNKSCTVGVESVVEQNAGIDRTKRKPGNTDKVKLQPKNKRPKSTPITAVSKEATVKRFTELLQEQNLRNEPDDALDAESKETKVELEKEVDSFFMTEDGESEYLSVAVPKSNVPEQDGQDEDQDEYSMHRNGNFRNATGGQFQRNRSDRFFHNLDKFSARNERPNWSRSDDKWNHSSKDGASFEKRPRREFEQKHAVVEEKMHPSWAAKKKQQEVLKQGFQGKKIVFDD